MKLGLSLAGGGIKGVAHIGALKAFEEKTYTLIIYQERPQEAL